jgi:hypothetical protein
MNRFVSKTFNEQDKTYAVYDNYLKKFLEETETTDLGSCNEWAAEENYNVTPDHSHGSIYGERVYHYY